MSGQAATGQIVFRPEGVLYGTDLEALRAYWVQVMRRHLHDLHRSSGVIEGLGVAWMGDKFTVRPGLALDPTGRLLILPKRFKGSKAGGPGRGVVVLAAPEGPGSPMVVKNPIVSVMDEPLEGAVVLTGASRPLAGRAFRRPFVASESVLAGTTVNQLPPWGWSLAVDTSAAGFLKWPGKPGKPSKAPVYFVRLGDGKESDVLLLRTGAPVPSLAKKVALEKVAPGHGPFIAIRNASPTGFHLDVVYAKALETFQNEKMAVSPVIVHWTGVESSPPVRLKKRRPSAQPKKRRPS